MPRTTILLPVLLVASAAVGAMQDATRTDATRMERKLVAIAERGALPANKRTAPLRTSFTDREVNAYFKVNERDLFPEGVMSPQIGLNDRGKVNAKATVDLDAALKPKERSWLDPLAWFSGTVEVTAGGTVAGANGMGHLQLETATLNGISIPPGLLQQLVTYYTRTPENPAGFDLAKPFPLPANIRAVESQRGTATVIQ